MDTEIERSEAELNSFLDRQAAKVKEARAGQEHANRIEAELQLADARRTAQMHQENRALWYAHYCKMAESHARISQDYEARAEALCEGGDAA